MSLTFVLTALFIGRKRGRLDLLTFTYGCYFDILGKMKKPLAIILTVLFWLIINFLFVFKTSNLSFSVLSHHYPTKIFTTPANQQLLKGNTLASEIKVLDNYLGIIAIRFEAFDQSVKDRIKFTLTEKGSNLPYFSTIINTDQFVSNELFPFGFPIINDSQHKTYKIEVKSLSGKKNMAVALSAQEPALIAYHQFPSREFKSDPGKLFYFLTCKTLSSFRDVKTFGGSMLATLPFFLVLFWHLLIRILPRKLSFYQPMFFLAALFYLFYWGLGQLFSFNSSWLLILTKGFILLGGFQLIYLCLKALFYEK